MRDILCGVFFFQAEDGIRDLVRSRGLGDVYKRQLAQLLARRLGQACRLGLDLLTQEVLEILGKDHRLSLIHI